MQGQVVRLQTPQGYDRTGMMKEVCEEPRSYLFQSEGKLCRRNRRHILPVVKPAPAQHTDFQDSDPRSGDYDTHTGDSGEMMDAEQFKVEGPPDGLPLNAAKSPYRTSSGRISKPNPKYQD